MELDEPLTHIARTPLPWRDATRTVCGRPINQYADGLVVPLVDAQAMRRRLGQQRFAMVICMTCANHIGNWSRWEDDPVHRMAREVGDGLYRRAEPVVEHELRAIAALIEAHRAEFDSIVDGYASGEVVTMADLRKRRSTRR